MSIGPGRASRGAAESARASSPPELATAYTVGEFFVARTPLLAMNCLVRWGERQRDAELDWDARLAELSRTLLAEFSKPALNAALRLASSDAHALLADGPSGHAPSSPKALRTLTRYFLRAASRETPFGLFAGLSLGTIGTEDNLRLSAADRYRASTRIALSYLRDLLKGLAARADVRDKLVYDRNSTLSLVQGNYRAVEVTKAASTKTTVLSIEASQELTAVLELARGGTNVPALFAVLREYGCSDAEITPFIEQLCARQLLVPSWLPTATGTGAIDAAIEQLSPHGELAAASESLRALRSELSLAEAAPLDEQGSHIQRARACLAQLECGSPVQPLQTDLVKPAPELVLGQATAQALLAAAALVQRTRRVTVDGELVEFCKRFSARYEGRLVPLAEVVDRDLGIGFGNADAYARDELIANLPLRKRAQTSTFSELDRVRLRLWQRSLAGGHAVCALDEQDLERLDAADPNAQLPESFAVIARLCREPGGRLLVVAPVVTSATALLGRFCEAEPALEQALRRLAAREQTLAGDVVLAEVAYMPDDKSANIVTRPCLRAYEIPCLGRSSAPSDRQLGIDDLCVGVEHGRAQLYSRRLQQRVSVRISNAHNFEATSCPTVYRFFGALQRQDTALSSGWSWGVLEDSDFLPRIVHGSTVLSLARWRVRLGQLRDGSAQVQPATFAAVQRLRAELGLPRFVTRAEGDQRMVVDLDNELSVDELLHQARKSQSVALEELLPGPDELVMHGPEGYFGAELVVPFSRRQPARARRLPEALKHGGLRRGHEGRYAPGADWLYAKIYCPRSLLDIVLRVLKEQVIVPLLGSTVASWFYLPFADPEPHLRLRLQGPAATLQSVAMTQLEQALSPLVEGGSVWRWEVSTYEQELERYGGLRHIALAERVFFADSEAAAALSELCSGASVALRWQLALVGIDRLFDDAGLSEPQRAALARSLSEAYGREFGADGNTRKTLGLKYREHAKRLTEMLWHEPAADDAVLREATRVWARRREQLRPTWDEYRRGERAGELSPPLAELCASFAHLHAIRLVGLSARTHELVLFDFLQRQYTSRAKQHLARGRAQAL